MSCPNSCEKKCEDCKTTIYFKSCGGPRDVLKSGGHVIFEKTKGMNTNAEVCHDTIKIHHENVYVLCVEFGAYLVCPVAEEA